MISYPCPSFNASLLVKGPPEQVRLAARLQETYDNNTIYMDGLRLISFGTRSVAYKLCDSFFCIWCELSNSGSWWKHFPTTGTSCGELIDHRWIPFTKGQWFGALVFPLVSASANWGTNDRNAGELKFLLVIWRRCNGYGLYQPITQIHRR